MDLNDKDSFRIFCDVLDEEIEAFEAFLEKIRVNNFVDQWNRFLPDFLSVFHIKTVRPVQDVEFQALAAVILRLSSEFTNPIAELADSYHRYWFGTGNAGCLDRLRRRRQTLLHETNEKNPIIAMQFLDGSEHWLTAQDGVVFQVAHEFAEAGIPLNSLREALFDVRSGMFSTK